MNDPRTTREALIAEALGDLGLLIGQTHALLPLMNGAREALVDAHGQLLREAAAQRASFEQQLAQVGDRAKTQVVDHVVARADELYRRKLREQEGIAREAVRALLAEEVDQAAQRLAATRRELSVSKDRLFEAVLSHLAVAVAGSALTWMLMTWIAVK